MGFYLFADTCLSWAPPLFFTAMNEAGVSERIGLSSITIFFMGGILALWKMGSYDDSVKTANRLVVAVPSSAPMMAISEDHECEASASNKNEPDDIMETNPQPPLVEP